MLKGKYAETATPKVLLYLHVTCIKKTYSMLKEVPLNLSIIKGWGYVSVYRFCSSSTFYTCDIPYKIEINFRSNNIWHVAVEQIFISPHNMLQNKQNQQQNTLVNIVKGNDLVKHNY